MKWTYANLNGDWENEGFTTKQEAIENGIANHDGDFLIGQLIETDSLMFAVQHIETIEQGVTV